MTKARTAILQALAQAKEPVSATMVASQLGNCCDPATVYRNLHFLEDHGYAQSFILHCSEHGTERYYTHRSAEDGHHHHWFHCEKCHSFIDLGDCQYHETLEQLENTYRFSIHEHTFFLTGICEACKQS